MMKKFAQWFSYVSLAFVLSVAVWDGLSTNADAQSGGGYPSNPNFQSVRIKGASLYSPCTVVLSTGSSKTSNTTVAVDPTLQCVLQAGTYQLTLGGAGIGGSGSGNIQVAFGLSAANNTYATYAICNFVAPGYGNGFVAGSVISTSPTSGNDCFSSYVTAAYTPYMTGLVTLNATTTVGVWWAQATSSATATTLNAGTVFTAVRIL